MRLLRPYEGHDLYSYLMIFKGLRSATPVWLLLSSCRAVAASPLQHDHNWKRDDNGSGFSPTIWIPVVIVAIILVGLVLLSWTNRSLRRGIGSMVHPGAAAGQVSPGGTTARELTAEQLAGTINANNTTNANTAGRTRRNRRPRRTPSQVSVTSLPPYNKEPGDQELVIFRGQDMEDASMPTAVVMDSVDEDAESTHSRDRSQVSRYSPMPTSPNNMPLLHDGFDTSGDLSLHNDSMPRRSYDTNHSSQEASSLMRANSNVSDTPDPRGEAPPYFEVVDVDVTLPNPTNSEEPLRSGNSLSPSNSPERQERRSGFRSLFNRMSVVGAPRALSHARGDSNASYLSSSLSHGAESSPATSRHRPSPSASSSFFRPLSRQKSQSTVHSVNNPIPLNSPSLISLNSISAPLTHTVIRTEFTYPKSGLTADQLKVISSRENFARFGMPYGADAIAYAASSSRVELVPPPPDFETIAGSSSTSLIIADGNGNLGHARSQSAGHLGSTSSLQVESTTSADLRQQFPSLPQASYPPQPASTVSSVSIATSTATNDFNANTPKFMTDDSTPSSPKASINALNASSTSAASSSKPQLIVSEFGKLSTPLLSLPKSASSSRSESRASAYSNQSYATAAESWRGYVGDSNAGNDDDDDGPTTPTTPSMPLNSISVGGDHTQKPTDTTIIVKKDGGGVDASSLMLASGSMSATQS